ncbi:MAG: tetrahydrofolate dehydrogenase/cyclohydrolase catalytic domain-containing protein [Acidithiobacillus sp.]
MTVMAGARPISQYWLARDLNNQLSTYGRSSMTAKILDGKWLSKSLRQKLRERAAALLEDDIQPGLAVVLLGDDPASKDYVNNKVRACEECGVRSFRLPCRSKCRGTRISGLRFPAI